MGLPGINLAETRVPIAIERPKAPGGKPDVADVIYAIHRCYEGHGEELPQGSELIHDADGPTRVTPLSVAKGAVMLSDRIIFGLLAVAVLSLANTDQSVPDSYFLTFGDHAKLPINEWWGRTAEFSTIVAQDPMPQVKLDLGDYPPPKTSTPPRPITTPSPTLGSDHAQRQQQTNGEGTKRNVSVHVS